MHEQEVTLVVRGGSVVGPDGLTRADVAVGGGRVVGLADSIDPPKGATVLDAGGCLVGPGLVDLHTHLRQPGREEAETIETGARAAALGGYTAVVAMPNTEPPIDSAGVVREILDLADGCAAEVAVSGAITLGRAGRALAPMGELAALGVTLFTDDGAGVQDGALMRRALDYAKGLGVTLAQHCEDSCLADGGAMHEGEWSSRLGIPGMPAAAEEAMVARDIALVRLTGAPVHFLHLSTAGSVDLVRLAKAEGLAVTAEAAPHHMLLTHAQVAGYDPVFKVNPPLRTDEDVAAVVAGLCDGTIDAVATDHAPHAPEAKDVPFDQAPPGMLGLQTALPIAWEVLSPRLGPERVFALMSAQPAAIARLTATDPRPSGHSAQGGPVERGAAANLCVFDPAATTLVEPGRLASRSRNTPYAGRTFQGAVRHTVLRGEPVVIDAVAQR
ncbi:MAG TPA: dihydroorotase [Acidimicrobiales bacterium]|nr:dihydroorotase [Acidimicrobiales bacterium]